MGSLTSHFAAQDAAEATLAAQCDQTERWHHLSTEYPQQPATQHSAKTTYIPSPW